MPQDAILLLSSGHRLPEEMPAGWVEGMLAFLDQNPRVHWLLVGISDTQRATLPWQHARLHVTEPRLDLEALIAACDIYLNPPRMGGGSTVAMAMAQGVAVLSLAGSDGGDKAGPLAVNDTKVYMERLLDWIENPGRRRAAGGALQKRYHRELDLASPGAARKLVQACEQALARFETRQNKGKEHELKPQAFE